MNEVDLHTVINPTTHIMHRNARQQNHAVKSFLPSIHRASVTSSIAPGTSVKPEDSKVQDQLVQSLFLSPAARHTLTEWDYNAALT